MSENKTLKELAQAVTLTCEHGAHMPWDKQSDWQQQANGYRCVIRYQGRRYSFDFWMGPAHTGGPAVDDVLDCLLSDAQAGEQTFEDFCGDLGYDEDSRKAYAMWQACERTARHMRRLLGDDFETFLYAERN